MIIVTIKDDCLEVKGHALFAKEGQDIVCASVSTSLIMTINQVEICGLKDQIKYQLDAGLAKIDILSHTTLLDQIISNLIYTLEDLAKSYPKNLKISK